MIRISPFFGEIPRLHQKMLPENYASKAENCDLSAATLKAGRSHRFIQKVGHVKSIHRSPDGTLYKWPVAGVNMVKSPLNDDVWDRLYWTGDGPPKMATSTMANGQNPPSASLLLGIPAPESELTIVAGPPPEDEGGYDITVTYTMTFVSAFGEEGPPAPASRVISKHQSANVTVSNIPVPPTNGHNITTKRVYRAEASGSFLLVAEIPASTTSEVDTIPTENLGEPLPSLEWDMPDPRMIGLTNIGNGILAGWFDNTLCFCEPYRPHAWPVGYQMGFSSNIVGIVPTSNGVIVTTEHEPWVVTGTTPAAMSQTKLDFPFGNLSRYSTVDMGEYAIYAAKDGLVALGGSQPSIITEQLISREQWQAFNAETLMAFRWQEKYLGFYKDNNGQSKAFTVDSEFGVVHYSVPDVATGFYDQATGELLIVSNGDLLSFQDGDRGSFLWASKLYTLPHQGSISSAKIDADGYPISLTITANGNQIFSESITSEQPFRLPAGRYREWQIQLAGGGNTEVYSVQMGGSPTEFL